MPGPVPTRPATRPPIRRAAGERTAAWLVTGPAGHLWSVLADLGVLWARYAWARARGTRPGWFE